MAAYKEQVIELRQRYLKLAEKLKLDADTTSRVKFKTVDNALGDEADFVLYDMCMASAPAFLSASFRNNLALTRGKGFIVVIENRGNFVGHEESQARPRCGRGDIILRRVLPFGWTVDPFSYLHMLNGNALRRMALASTNVHNLRMTSPIVRTTKLLKDVNLRKITGHKIVDAPERLHNRKPQPLLTLSADDTTQALTPLAGKRKESLQRRQCPEAAAGTAEMNRVAVEDPTKGLQWAFCLARDSLRDSFPESAIGRVRWLCFDSPKYCWTLAKVVELYLEGKRALIYVNNPLAGVIPT
ncbi:hypothetical protein ACLX1H_007651 [Fusarium chlamydosporum]